MSTLLGPDGKEMVTPKQRAMPTRQEKFNMVLMMFTLMTSEERRTLVKQLRPLRRKLDLMYPNGMSEADIQADMQKAAKAVAEEAEAAPEPMSAEEEALEREIAESAVEVVPDEANNAKPEGEEVGPEQNIPVQPEGDQGC